MIEVLRGPRKPKVTCPDCEAVLKYDKEDVHKINISPYLYNEEFVECITCPFCSKEISIRE